MRTPAHVLRRHLLGVVLLSFLMNMPRPTMAFRWNYDQLAVMTSSTTDLCRPADVCRRCSPDPPESSCSPRSERRRRLLLGSIYLVYHRCSWLMMMMMMIGNGVDVQWRSSANERFRRMEKDSLRSSCYSVPTFVRCRTESLTSKAWFDVESFTVARLRWFPDHVLLHTRAPEGEHIRVQCGRHVDGAAAAPQASQVSCARRRGRCVDENATRIPIYHRSDMSKPVVLVV